MLVYVCSPLRAYTDPETNLDHTFKGNLNRARQYSHQVARLGHFPLAPHLLLTQFLDDDIPEERDLGMTLGLNILTQTDQLWVFGAYLSAGMRNEIRLALEEQLPIQWFQDGIAKVLPEQERYRLTLDLLRQLELRTS